MENLFSQPSIPESVFVARGAVIAGDVTLGEESSVWFNAVIRGDENRIVIGERSNIQDNCTLHVNEPNPMTIGNDVTVGHNAVLHGCTVGDGSLIGMSATVLDGAKIGSGCLIGAGALVTEGSEIPDGSLVVGVPGKIRRTLTEEEQQKLKENAAIYVREAKRYLENAEINDSAWV